MLGIYEEITFLQSESEELKLSDEAIGMKVDIKRKLMTNENKERLKLLNTDSKIFENYLTQVFDKKEKGKFGNRIFVNRYKYIQSLLRDQENEDPVKKFEKLERFYRKLNAVELLRIKVDNITDAFSVFTSLNAKGMPLTLIDLLKSYYLGQATREGKEEEKALKEWNDLIEIFTVDRGEPNSTAISQFLQNNYDAFEGSGTSSITKKQSLHKYERLFSKIGSKYIETLLENAKLFSIIVPRIDTAEEINTTNDEILTLLDKISKLEATPVYPLVLFLLKKHKNMEIKDTVLEKILSYLVNFYVRRNLVLKPKSSNIRSKAIQVVRECQLDTVDLNKDILEIIERLLGEIKPTNQDFKVALEGSIYDISAKTARLILIDIERKHGDYFHKQNPDNLDKVNDKGKLFWTLEHILPQSQNLSNEWKEMISPENIDLAKTIQMEHMHKLGNLTLTGYNPEMSDKNFIDKRDYKPKKSDKFNGLRTELFLNSSIADKNEDIEKKEKWTVEDIERRTKILSSMAQELYSFDNFE